MYDIKLPIVNVPKTCDGCGVCCLYMRTPPFLFGSFWRSHGAPLEDISELHNLPKYLRNELIHHLENNCDGDPYVPCCWFDPETKQCRHYEWRPRPCRDFKVGGDDCLTARENAWREKYTWHLEPSREK
jgi:Fe-S-cluster containining protein